jgi:hypothetical protein
MPRRAPLVFSGRLMARNRVNSEEIEALDQALRSLFLGLQTRALPDSLRTNGLDELLDQLCGVRAETPGDRA